MPILKRKEHITALILLSSLIVAFGCILSSGSQQRALQLDSRVPIASSSDQVGLIVMWTRPLYQIPTGWVLCDGTGGTMNLANRFVLGADDGENPGQTGGSATHAHDYSTLTDHTHTITDPGHIHTYTRTGCWEIDRTTPTTVLSLPTYTTYNTDSSSTGITLQSTGIVECTTNLGNNTPPYVKLAFLMKTDSEALIPEGAIVFWPGNIDDIPSGWTLCDGTAGTINMTGLFAMGVESWEDPGKIDGDSSHTHAYTDVPRHAHAKSDPGHVHSYTGSDMSNQPCKIAISSLNLLDNDLVSSTSTTGITVNQAGSASCTTNRSTSLPPYCKLAYIMKNSTDTVLPTGIITMWGRYPQFIPSSWTICNGFTGTPDLANRFILGAKYNDVPKEIGGDTPHVHSYTDVPIHTHGITDPGHSHEYNYVSTSVANYIGTGSTMGPRITTTSTQNTGSSTTGITIIANGSTNGETDSNTNLPPYCKLIFIQHVNHVPEAINLAIAPGTPVTTDALVLSFGYHDDDSDALAGSKIWWYVDSVHQAAYDNMTTIPASVTTKLQEWLANVWVNDGKEFGPYNTTSVTIQNSPALINTARLSPSPAATGSDLVLLCSTQDPDGDTVSLNITWFNNGAHVPSLDNATSVLASMLHVGDEWYAVVQPWDGTSVGMPVQTGTATIQDAPTMDDGVVFTIVIIGVIGGVAIGAMFSYKVVKKKRKAPKKVVK